MAIIPGMLKSSLSAAEIEGAEIELPETEYEKRKRVYVEYRKRLLEIEVFNTAWDEAENEYALRETQAAAAEKLRKIMELDIPDFAEAEDLLPYIAAVEARFANLRPLSAKERAHLDWQFGGRPTAPSLPSACGPAPATPESVASPEDPR